MERSATSTTLVERDKLELSSLVPPKGEIKSSFSWTCPFKCPTSSTLCFGEPTLGKLNQETEFYMTKHMPKSTSETNRVSDCHSSLVTTPSSRLILDEPKIEVAKALIHHIGKNREHFYGETSYMIFLSHGSTSRKLTGETNSSSTTLYLDTCSRKLSGETNLTAPHVDVLWLTGMSPCSLKLVGEHITQVSSSFW